MIDRNLPIFVTGRRGLAGSAIVRRLAQAGFSRILAPARAELDLRDQASVSSWFKAHRPAYVIHAAGRVGGIQANVSHPAEFLYDNLMIHATVLQAACRANVEKLLYLGSSCIYPCECPQPMREEYLLTGPLEKTNEAYAVAKLAGVKSCEAYRTQYGCRFIAALPTNLYGPGDNFDPVSSHVVPALIRKFDDARRSGARHAMVWGTGSPRREFLHVDDLADACLFLMDHYDAAEPINVGTGEDQTIGELAAMIRDVVSPGIDIVFDASKPDGAPQKLLDVAKLHALGWRHQIAWSDGLAATYQWYCSRQSEAVR